MGALGCRPDLLGAQSPNPFFASRLQFDSFLILYREAIQKYGKSRNLRFLAEFEAEPQSSPSSFSKSFSF